MTESTGLELTIRAYWRGDALSVWHLNPPRSFRVGDDAATCDCVVADAGPGLAQVTLVEVTSAGIRVAGREAPLVESMVVQAEAGALRFEIQLDRASGRWKRSFLGHRARALAGSFALVASLCGGGLGVAAARDRPPTEEEQELDKDTFCYMEGMLKRAQAEEDERELEQAAERARQQAQRRRDDIRCRIDVAGPLDNRNDDYWREYYDTAEFSMHRCGEPGVGLELRPSHPELQKAAQQLEACYDLGAQSYFAGPRAVALRTERDGSGKPMLRLDGPHLDPTGLESCVWRTVQHLDFWRGRAEGSRLVIDFYPGQPGRGAPPELDGQWGWGEVTSEVLSRCLLPPWKTYPLMWRP